MAAFFGPRLWKIANPAMTETQYWVGPAKARLERQLARGGDPNAMSGQGVTPLFLAARWGKAADIATLLGAGAAVDLTGYHGQTPLMAAADGGPLENVRTLLEAGAAVDAVDDGGLGLAHYAVRLGAPLATQGECLALLVAAGAPVNLASADGQTPLHWAATSYLPEAVLPPLLAAGAALEARDRAGNTALHLAVRADATVAVRLLLEAGADRTLRNAAGRTPLEEARANAMPADSPALALLAV